MVCIITPIAPSDYTPVAANEKCLLWEVRAGS